jgi:enoyl-CoA hydratase/carnithine racemase
MAGTIHFVADAGVATVTLDSPGKLNAVNVAMWHELRRVFEAMAAEEHVRCVVVRGAGGNFAAGADLAEFDEVRFEHVRRSDNAHADRLANAAMDEAATPRSADSV